MSTAAWSLLALGVAALSLAAALRGLRGVADVPTRFLVLALWLRYAVAAFPDITTVPRLGPLSISALASVAVIAAAYLLLDARYLRLRRLWPVYLYVGITLFSGLVNRHLGLLVNVTISWSYMIAIALLVCRAVTLFGPDRAPRLMIAPLAMPAVLGLLSWAVGYGEYSYFDDSYSFRGGYLHEAIFSQIVFTFIVAAALIRWRRWWTGVALMMLGVLAIAAANYRTVIVALGPMVLVLAFDALRSLTPARFRAPAVIVGGVAMAALLVAVLSNLPDRFADLLIVSRLGEVPLTDPELLNKGELRIMNGRLHLWNLYLNDYLDSDLLTHLLGFGPESWTTQSHLFLHAHNNFILDLYSIGAIGLVALLIMYGMNMIYALSAPESFYGIRLFALQAGYMLVNMATSPLIVIEGMLFYSLVFGVTWAVAAPSQARPPLLQAGPASA